MIIYLIKLRKFLLRFIPKNRLLGWIYRELFYVFAPKTIERNGFKIFIQGGDFFSGDYEPEVTEWFKKFIKPDWVVADIGANIGYHTLMLSKLAKKVFAFEPCRETFSYLRKNVEINKISNVELYNKGLSDKNGYALLEKKGDSGSFKIGNWGERIEIMKANDLNVQFNLLKIDVEGHEINVLRGGNLLLKNKPILIVEYNPIVNKKAKEMLEFLQNNKYQFYFRDKKISIDELLLYKEHVNLLCL